MASEIVYILTNESMLGYVKIGTTGDLEQRMRQLDSTGVALPFECFYARRVDDAAFVEKALHDAFSDHRVRKNREFFRIDPERVLSALKISAGEDVLVDEKNVVESQDDIDAIIRAKNRKRNFEFNMIGLQPGEVLHHTHDSTATCTVYDDRNVLFENEVKSLSKSAGIVMERQGLSPLVAGPAYWTHKGKKLYEIRDEMEGD